MRRVWPLLVLVELLGWQPSPASAQTKLHVKEKSVEFEGRGGGAFSPDATVYVPSPFGSKLRVYDAATGKEIASRMTPLPREAGTPYPTVCAFSPDGTLFAFTIRGGVSLWETKKWKQVAVLRMPDTRALAFSPDSRSLAVQHSFPPDPNHPPAVSIWDLKGDKGVYERASLQGGHSAPVYSPDGKLLFIGDTFWITETEDSWKFLGGKVLPEGVNKLSHVSFSPDSKLFFAFAYSSGEFGERKVEGFIRDVKTGKGVLVTEVGPGERWKSVFSPDGKVLAVQGPGIELIAVETGKKLATIKGAFFPVVFSEDGKTLTSRGNSTIKTWELTWEKEPGK